jgi:hypothetical protein
MRADLHNEGRRQGVNASLICRPTAAQGSLIGKENLSRRPWADAVLAARHRNSPIEAARPTYKDRSSGAIRLRGRPGQIIEASE